MNRSRRLSNVFFTFLGAAAVGLVIAILSVTGVLDDVGNGHRQTVVTTPPPSSTIDAAPEVAPPVSAPTDVSGIYARVAPGVAFISASGAPAGTQLGGGEQSSARGSRLLIQGHGHAGA